MKIIICKISRRAFVVAMNVAEFMTLMSFVMAESRVPSLFFMKKSRLK